MPPADRKDLTPRDLEEMSRKLRALIAQAQEIRDDVNRRLAEARLADQVTRTRTRPLPARRRSR